MCDKRAPARARQNSITLVLSKLEFIDDLALLPDPPKQAFVQDGRRNLESVYGDHTGTLKPEYDRDRAPTEANPVAYRRAVTMKVRATFVAFFSGGHNEGLMTNLEARAITPTSTRGDFTIASGDAFSFSRHGGPNDILYDGVPKDIVIEALRPLDDRIDRYRLRLRFTATIQTEDLAAPEEPELDVLTTWERPAGQVEIHSDPLTAHPFPETGAIQSVTAARLSWAVAAARGAGSDSEALDRLFTHLKRQGVTYYSDHRFSSATNTTHLQPLPSLHHFLWLALTNQKIAECQDLGAAFRLAGRILGVQGTMEVRQLYPWDPWENTAGKRRAGRPLQGSLRPCSSHPAGRRVVFFDSGDRINQYEGVMAWQRSGASNLAFFAIGEHIFDHFTRSNNLDGVGTVDQNNANLFYCLNVSFKDGDHVRPDGDTARMTEGIFKLGIVEEVTPGRFQLVKQPYPFMRPNQTLFMFHYGNDQFEPGDDRVMDADGRLVAPSP